MGKKEEEAAPSCSAFGLVKKRFGGLKPLPFPFSGLGSRIWCKRARGKTSSPKGELQDRGGPSLLKKTRARRGGGGKVKGFGGEGAPFFIIQGGHNIKRSERGGWVGESLAISLPLPPPTTSKRQNGCIPLVLVSYGGGKRMSWERPRGFAPWGAGQSKAPLCRRRVGVARRKVRARGWGMNGSRSFPWGVRVSCKGGGSP